MKQLLLSVILTSLVTTSYAQLNLTARCIHSKDDKYVIVLNGVIDKGWRMYTFGDSSLHLTPFTIAWSETVIEKSGLSETINEQEIKDPLFDNRKLQVVLGKFEYRQPVIIKGAPPATILLKIAGFAANNEQFVPVDQKLQAAIEGGENNKSNEENLILSSIDLSKPVNSCGEQHEKASLWLVFLKGFSGGLVAMLMPCIFPMIPVTISVFTVKSNGVRNSIIYGLSIILIYVLASLPFHLISGLNPQVLNEVSTNVTVNLVFFFIFVAFALSLFGIFEIRLPAALGNNAGNKSNAASLTGIFFMALTLCIISFSCTGPILGFLLAGTIDDGAWPLTVGMCGFGLALALPFSLFALFPQWLKRLPKSGEWMEVLKKAFAFIELALALKFLSNADLIKHWGLLKRETFIFIWMAISLALAGFVLLKARGSYAMGLFSFVILIFSLYLGIGLIGQSQLSLLSGFPPPVSYSIHFNPEAQQQPAIVNDYQKALTMAKQQHKPILIDFTGWACVNCRKMEENVWSKPFIKDMLANKFILVSLYVDDRKKLDHPFMSGDQEIATVGDKWAHFQSLNFKQSSQPLYVILNEREEILNNPVGYTPDEQLYKQWLECGIKANNNQP